MKASRFPDRLMALLLAGMSSSAWAADLVVEENGIAPNYSSIQAAVTAASPGDRIFVKNKAALVPYQESVTIDKPVELLPFTSNGQFFVLGNYTITPNAGNFSVTDFGLTGSPDEPTLSQVINFMRGEDSVGVEN